MRMFMCWSGNRSQAVAEAFREWLPAVIGKDCVEIFISSEIRKGEVWFDKITRELESVDAGVICLTPENLSSSWLHFEAGALATVLRGRQRRPFTYLYDVEAGAIPGPLQEYQWTMSTRADTRRLVKDIIDSVDRPLPASESWESTFDREWERLDTALHRIPPVPTAKLLPNLDELFARKTFQEPFADCTTQDWIGRYGGTVETSERLLAHKAIVRSSGGPDLLLEYETLLRWLDEYAMNIRSSLLGQRELDKEGGKLVVPSDVASCEVLRANIADLVSRMLLRNGSPVLQVSRRFCLLDELEHKLDLIHQFETAIQRGDSPVAAERLHDCVGSYWDFDRIVYYLVQEEAPNANQADLTDGVRREMEKLRVRAGRSSRIPLRYALRALKTRVFVAAAPAELYRRLRRTVEDAAVFCRTAAGPDLEVDRTILEYAAVIVERLDRMEMCRIQSSAQTPSAS